MKLRKCERTITITLDDFVEDRQFLQQSVEESIAAMTYEEDAVSYFVGVPKSADVWHGVVSAINMLNEKFGECYDIVDLRFEEASGNADLWCWLSFSITRRKADSMNEEDCDCDCDCGDW